MRKNFLAKKEEITMQSIHFYSHDQYISIIGGNHEQEPMEIRSEENLHIRDGSRQEEDDAEEYEQDRIARRRVSGPATREGLRRLGPVTPAQRQTGGVRVRQLDTPRIESGAEFWLAYAMAVFGCLKLTEEEPQRLHCTDQASSISAATRSVTRESKLLIKLSKSMSYYGSTKLFHSEVFLAPIQIKLSTRISRIV